MIIDTDAHVVPGSLIETLRSERRSFPSVRLLAEADSARMAFAGEEGAEWTRCFNEHLTNDAIALAALTPLATVSSQDGALAARVLEEALDNGFKGAMIGTNPRAWAEISTSVPAPC